MAAVAAAVAPYAQWLPAPIRPGLTYRGVPLVFDPIVGRAIYAIPKGQYGWVQTTPDAESRS